MRFLKRKIQLKQESEDIKKSAVQSEKEVSVAETVDTETGSSPMTQEYLLPMRKPRQKSSCPEGNSKNIVKNYGKALCSFGSSHIAIPYIEAIISKKSYDFINVKEFMAYIKGKKDGVNSIESLRKVLIADFDDDKVVQTYKAIFQELSIIFLKYFAVNWIYSGKLMHKNAHLKFRFKMLRRIQNPEYFTYLKTSAK